jgi:hypothetical protein
MSNMAGAMNAYRNIYRNLDLNRFSHVFDNNTQGYKYYWLEAIIDECIRGRISFTFEELAERMIANAWYTVTVYHLNLGPRHESGARMNRLELAVELLQSSCSRTGEMPELSNTAGSDDIIEKAKKYSSVLSELMNKLTLYVPYRLLSCYLPEGVGSMSQEEVIAAMEAVNQNILLPYMVEKDNKNRLQSRVTVPEEWKVFFQKESFMLKGWIQNEKVRFLQDRNPDVPGIIYKLEAPSGKRDYPAVKELWKEVLQMREVKDIYTGVSLQEEKYDMDHFVPWSFVASDELWNLTPAEHILNIRKSDSLPVWDDFITPYLEQQYSIYELVISEKNDNLSKAFAQCRSHNIHAPWALSELYVPSNTEEQFKNVLNRNLKAVYDNARLQGFTDDFSLQKIQAAAFSTD